MRLELKLEMKLELKQKKFRIEKGNKSSNKNWKK